MSDKKIEQFWRPATADDVARVMQGETVEAMVRDDDDDDWRYGEYLGGIHRGNCEEFKWVDRDGVPWKQCQVYDPPEILKNKPDPGEGWRLLEKFPHEPIIGTDDYWSTAKAKWMPIVKLTTNKQPEKTWFRRRIETNSPTILASSRSRNKIPSGWRVLSKDEDRLASDLYWSRSCSEWILIGEYRVDYANEPGHKWHAIRRVTSTKELTLTEGFIYALPSGDHIRITDKGFEVV